MDHPMTVTVRLSPTDEPARRGPDPTEDLRRELASLGEARIGASSGPPHMRSIDLATLAEIVVTLSGVAGGLGAVVEAVRGFLKTRAPARTARLEIDGDVLVATGLDSDEQQALIHRWLERHEAPSS
jgi:hypothetical protein